MDAFIEAEIKPLERDHIQYFDQRREYARTDWDNGGTPRRAWEDLLGEMRRRADKAGWLRYGLPAQFGGRDGTNIDMAVIREHLAHKGLGLHNDLQDESSIVGNFPQVIMMDRFGTDTQKAEWTEALITGERSMAFGLTEPNHGSDATWLETRAVSDGDGGSSTAAGGSTPACTGLRTTSFSPERPVILASRGASPRSSCRPTPSDSPCLTTGGRSTCRPITARSSSTMFRCPGMLCSVRWVVGWRWVRPFCTRTGFGRQPAASAPLSTASTVPSRTPTTGMCSANRWR